MGAPEEINPANHPTISGLVVAAGALLAVFCLGGAAVGASVAYYVVDKGTLSTVVGGVVGGVIFGGAAVKVIRG